MFSKYLKKPSKCLVLFWKETNFDHWEKNFQNFLVVIGVGEEDSGTSMLYWGIAILKNGCFSAIGDMEYTFLRTGLLEAWNWVLFQENSGENTGLAQYKKAWGYKYF